MKKYIFKYLFIIFSLLHFHVGYLYSQDVLRQTVRGVVTDKQSGQPISGASVIIRITEPPLATISGADGSYKIENVPLGRVTIECSFMGYHMISNSNVILSSAKELILNFELEEKSFDINEVVISANKRKDLPINKMAVISARSFTIEETGRYAGSYGDPARMASNYAGVMTGRDNRNDIIIRGNSSTGIIWRLDGIEISNPSHYAALGTTGGPITILNSNILTSSDFLSGAFPAEYGNALAGVFDLKMRAGNNEKCEKWIQTGWNGIEAGIEGPLTKKHRASYIVSYRYSILEILRLMNVDLGIDPKYQDMNFKLNMPYKNGTISILGLGGTSSIHIYDSEKKQEKWMFDESGENTFNKSALGTLAITNLHFFNDKTRLKTSLACSASELSSQIDTFSVNNMNLFAKAGEKSSEIRYSFASSLSKKINARNDLSFGCYYDLYNYSFSDSTFLNQQYRYYTNSSGFLQFYRLYGQIHTKLTKRFSAVAGLNYQMLELNNSHNIEPRLGLAYKLNDLNTLNMGFGMHSQMQPRMLYFALSQFADGTYGQSNIDLGFSKSNHFIIGHDYLISEHLRLKTECYYQYLYDIPVKQTLSAYSQLNAGVEYYVGRQDSLINYGTGRNYGIELTLEKFFNRNYFFLVTASVFNSQYSGVDNIVRSTAFNTNYLINVVGGYEKKIGPKKNGVLILGGRLTLNGGRPYVPFDVDATLANGYETLDWENAYNTKYADYRRYSLRFGFRRNKQKTSTELVWDLQYRTNYTNIYIERIDVTTGKIHNYQKMGFYPMVTWKINF